jgi:hypothetical protein
VAPRRGTIEITADVQVIVTGNKVGPSEAVLLSKLGIKPFTYGLVVKYVYDNGALYDPKAGQRCLLCCLAPLPLPLPWRPPPWRSLGPPGPHPPAARCRLIPPRCP